MTARARRNRRKAAGQKNQAPRLVGYVRVSTDEQSREGVSLRAQRERIAAYCTSQAIELVGIQTDGGVSGRVVPSKRPGLTRALEIIRTGDAEGLVVLKLDRLSRSTRDVLNLVDETKRDGWRLVSVSEQLDTATAAGRLVVTILSALAEMEAEQVSERTRFALDSIAREGIIKMKDIYEAIEEASDRCVDVADVVEDVVLKYA